MHLIEMKGASYQTYVMLWRRPDHPWFTFSERIRHHYNRFGVDWLMIPLNYRIYSW